MKKGNGKARKARFISRHIVCDPDIRGGRPTIIGTRIMVSDVLELVARGLPWAFISEQFHGSVSVEAIAESVQFASRAFEEHSNKYIVKEYVLARRA
jgi:uncharacterized protein (DUF433 family)